MQKILKVVFWFFLFALVLCYIGLPSGVEAGIIQRNIYAGETPLASTCTASLTNPMTITIPPCSFTTTGQAKVVSPDKAPANIADLIAQGKAESTASGKYRIWLQNQDGSVYSASRTVTLSTDTVLTIASPLINTYYRAGIGVNSGVGSILLQSSTDGNIWTPAPPVGWKLVHLLIFPFLVPVGDLNLSDNTIEIFTVLPGFPAGTGPEDFKIQTGQ